MNDTDKKSRFSVSLCITHNCNLNCIYCYQKHSDNCVMSFETAKKIIDWTFNNVPEGYNKILIDFFGGEPLLEFELIKEIFSYVNKLNTNYPYTFFASTNGTLLTDEMKEWFTEHKQSFILGLSLDGTRETHNFNRSNSFDKIDIDFFKRNWSNQTVKMTLSEFSLQNFAENIKYIHSLGFKISGVNLFEGNVDWSDEKHLKTLIPQLKELVEYYVENDQIEINQMFNKKLNICEVKKNGQKWCGIGKGMVFYDYDGKQYPCAFVTPMTLSQEDINQILKTDFSDDKLFLDEECYSSCYIFPICPTCAGADYLANKSFKIRKKDKCRIRKLIALFTADLQAKLILKNPNRYNNDVLYYTIEAIKKIKNIVSDTAFNQ